MNPLPVGPAPRVLTGCDDRAAAGTDRTRGVRLIIVPRVPRGAGLLLADVLGVFNPRAAQVF